MKRKEWKHRLKNERDKRNFPAKSINIFEQYQTHKLSVSSKYGFSKDYFLYDEDSCPEGLTKRFRRKNKEVLSTLVTAYNSGFKLSSRELLFNEEIKLRA